MGMKVSDLKIEIKEEITNYVFGQKEMSRYWRQHIELASVRRL